MTPLVSVICVCYNHTDFVIEALNSVKNQTYGRIELIIVDDGSSDGSLEKINAWIRNNPKYKFIDLKTNQGYCKAFNQALKEATGEFIIDLAGDDVLLPDRIEIGVQEFLRKGANYGVQFSDAVYIDINGNELHKHSDRFPHDRVPQGEIYTDVVSQYFICSPTVMIRKSILDSMGGYDESLRYEDFDLWVNAARVTLFFYVPKALVKKRIVSASLGSRQYSKERSQRESTYKVCLKVLKLNKTKAEKSALNVRIFYELKWSFRFFDLNLISKYLSLLVKNNF